MKKIIMAVAAIAMAASMFAVDFSATVKVKGDVVYNNGDGNTTLLGVENTKQKDNDLLEINFNGDKAGAFVRFWASAQEPTNYWSGAGDDGAIALGGEYGDKLNILSVRALKVWFQPIDMLKVTVGNNDIGLYTERINWWKVPCGASLAEFGAWDGRWASGAGVHENFGLTAEINVAGLYIGLGAASDAITFVKDADKPAMNQMGAVVKYSMDVGIPLSVGAAFRHTGSFNLVTIGADFGDFGTPYYAFLQAKLRLDDENQWWYAKPKLSGITIDNYISYNMGFMKLEATLPITIRGLLNKDDKTDASYMTARIKASIPVDAMTLYAVIGSDEGFNNGPASSPAATVWRFDDFGGSLNLYANLGVAFNVGVCSLDVGFELGYDKPSSTTAWAVPFSAQVAF